MQTTQAERLSIKNLIEHVIPKEKIAFTTLNPADKNFISEQIVPPIFSMGYCSGYLAAPSRAGDMEDDVNTYVSQYRFDERGYIEHICLVLNGPECTSLEKVID